MDLRAELQAADLVTLGWANPSSELQGAIIGATTIFPYVPDPVTPHGAPSTADKDLPLKDDAELHRNPDHLTKPQPDQRFESRLQLSTQPDLVDNSAAKQTSPAPLQHANDHDPAVAQDSNQETRPLAGNATGKQSSIFQAGHDALTHDSITPDRQKQHSKGLQKLQDGIADVEGAGKMVCQDPSHAAIGTQGSSNVNQINVPEACAGHQMASSEHVSTVTTNAASTEHATTRPMVPLTSVIPEIDTGRPGTSRDQAASEARPKTVGLPAHHPHKPAEPTLPPPGWHGWRRGKRKDAPRPGAVSNTEQSQTSRIPSMPSHNFEGLPPKVGYKMAQQLVEMATTCRAAPVTGPVRLQADPDAAQVITSNAASIQGRRVAFILPKDYQRRGADSCLDVIAAGVQTGQ